MSLLWLILGTLLLVRPAHAGPLTPEIQEMARLINAERTKAGLLPYRLSPLLAQAAQQHAAEMLRSGQYSHISPDGATLLVRLRRVGYPLDPHHPRAGENWGLFSSVQKCVQWWMDDPPHKHNILHPVYREMGIGIVRHPWGYLSVVDFALPDRATVSATPTPSPRKTPTPLPTATPRPVPSSRDLTLLVHRLNPPGPQACPWLLLTPVAGPFSPVVFQTPGG